MSLKVRSMSSECALLTHVALENQVSPLNVQLQGTPKVRHKFIPYIKKL